MKQYSAPDQMLLDMLNDQAFESIRVSDDNVDIFHAIITIVKKHNITHINSFTFESLLLLHPWLEFETEEDAVAHGLKYGAGMFEL